MELIISIDSLIVAGISMFLFNIFLFGVFQIVSQSICSSTNLHILYDQQLPLTPRQSRLGILFESSVGHISVVRLLSLLIVSFGIALIPLDFSINGSSRTEIVPTRYSSVAQSSPGNKPLNVNYENESKVINGNTFASRRLVAIADLHSCMFLNFSHHTIFALAFRDYNLDKTLIPIKEVISGGECVTGENFKNENIMHQWGQREYDGTECNMTMTKLEVDSDGTNSLVDARVISPEEPHCKIEFLTAKCFRSTNDNCVAIAVKKTDPTIGFLISIRNATNLGQNERHELRKLMNMSVDDRNQFASNVAFFQAVGFSQGVPAFIYMAVMSIIYDEDLFVLKKANITSINLALCIPALTIIVFVLPYMLSSHG